VRDWAFDRKLQIGFLPVSGVGGQERLRAVDLQPITIALHLERTPLRDNHKALAPVSFESFKYY